MAHTNTRRPVNFFDGLLSAVEAFSATPARDNCHGTGGMPHCLAT
jgi:hypothetical protein